MLTSQQVAATVQQPPNSSALIFGQIAELNTKGEHWNISKGLELNTTVFYLRILSSTHQSL